MKSLHFYLALLLLCSLDRINSQSMPDKDTDDTESVSGETEPGESGSGESGPGAGGSGESGSGESGSGAGESGNSVSGGPSQDPNDPGQCYTRVGCVGVPVPSTRGVCCDYMQEPMGNSFQSDHVEGCHVCPTGQAPGDHDETCRTGMNAALHNFPAEVKILMDTFDYTDLYGSARTPWTTVDGDGDGGNWDTIFGNPCTFGMNTCTRSLSQDNWLFSQFIRYVGAREVFFNATYRFNRCRSPCTKRYVDLYQHVRDSANAGARVQSSNYGQPFLRLEQPSGDDGSIDVTHAMPHPANRRGFYLGVRDEGTCGAVERIIVYYVACLGSVDGLVTYPETGVPVRGGSNVIFDAHCAPNAHNTTTLQVTAFASSSSCSPVAPGGARCECDAGYLISADGLSCRACRAGTYRTLSDSSCRICPQNTVTDDVAAPQCDCISGFFRSPLEGPETECTEPPGACTNLQLTASTDTSITVNWRRPTTTGRDDYFYSVFHRDPENIGRFPARSILIDRSSMVTFTLTSLVPFTPYIISVITHNGVSDQDMDNAHSRVCQITTVTTEGTPGQPGNVQGLCTAVAWQEPTQFNGVIIGYDVEFSVGRLTHVSTGETFLITATAERAPGTTVRVRAVNGAGPGAWTPPQDVGCQSCQECLPGQAPGDHDETCRTGMNAALHNFPAEVKILMDTFDYTDLYGSARSPWTAVDDDGDGRNWDTIFGNPCTFGLNTCTRSQSQDNWLFSQFIRYVGAKEVFFNVTYRFNRCRSPCTKRYADLYQHVRDSANAGARVQPSNYGQPFLRLEQPSGDEGSIDVTHAMSRPANRRGFYLGVRDEGTCGAVERIIVYYVACLESVDGLVTYPETGVPLRGGSNVVFDAHCAPNAHNTTTLQVTAFASSSSCSPVAPGGARCECDAGYLISADGVSCRACPAGTYHTLSDSSCRSCPPNTVTDDMAAPECNCIFGFFRTPQEGPETGCTQPPGVCTDLQVTARANTTITISWTRPTTTGRDDYFYTLLHSDPDNIGTFQFIANVTARSSTVTFTVSGLDPNTPYIIRVTTHNGVSDQDVENCDSRMCEVLNMTMEGPPGQPGNVQGLCTAVAWQEPTQPNGVIIGYDVQFSVGRMTRLGAGQTFLITATAERTPGSTVRVRAVNGAGPGAWTPPQDVGCRSAQSCQECLPDVHFKLHGATYLNNTVVVVDDIGEGENALFCVTENSACCRSTSEGEFMFPSGLLVPTNNRGQDFYRNRGSQFIRLNRRNSATSPLGKYSCEIPNASGDMQRIFLEVVESRHGACPTLTPPTPIQCPLLVTCPIPPVSCSNCPTPPTPTFPCPMCPPVSCPNCPPPPTPTFPCPTCPPVTCPNCPPPPTQTFPCPTCPPVTCPPPPTPTFPPISCPTCPPVSCPNFPTPPTSTSTPQTVLRFELRGTSFLNNTVVMVDDIGEGENALFCVTDNRFCCKDSRQGEFLFPDGSLVPVSRAGQDFYRNRGSQIIRLNRRNGAMSPVGRYGCEIPDSNGILQHVFIQVT